MFERRTQMFVAVGLFLALTLPSAAYNLVYVDKNGPQWPEGFQDVSGFVSATRSGTFRTGVFGMKFNPGTALVSPQFVFESICIDGAGNLGGGVYAIETIVDYTKILPSGDPPAVQLTDGIGGTKEKLGQLYQVAWQDVLTSNNSVKSSAFQWAAWEIARESPVSMGDLDGGAIRITSGNTAVINQAETYLGLINSNTPVMELYVWTPVVWDTLNGVEGWHRVSNGQELIVPVPEPGAVLLMGAVVGALGIAVFRRKRFSA